MRVKVTELRLDFSPDGTTEGSDVWAEVPSKEEQERIVQGIIGKVYEVEDASDDLGDAISDETGWCVHSLSYDKVV